ncbi:hypothetical protein BC936DRAFT_138184 [Jimgerdemannia flammicorona]|uniref:Uncharacterized protein n=1 Tax=Jimgerdemannia flammicorona TaxID=994334 RepID=A0A433DIL6_9FUNG|nr:hypothetical protein BC936DRAFT_138184 [Jimgerdemannia flammicorona]
MRTPLLALLMVVMLAKTSMATCSVFPGVISPGSVQYFAPEVTSTLTDVLTANNCSGVTFVTRLEQNSPANTYQCGTTHVPTDATTTFYFNCTVPVNQLPEGSFTLFIALSNIGSASIPFTLTHTKDSTTPDTNITTTVSFASTITTTTTFVTKPATTGGAVQQTTSPAMAIYEASIYDSPATASLVTVTTKIKKPAIVVSTVNATATYTKVQTVYPSGTDCCWTQPSNKTLQNKKRAANTYYSSPPTVSPTSTVFTYALY